MSGFITAMAVLAAVELALFPEYRRLSRWLERRRTVRRVRAEMATHIFWPLDDPDAVDAPSMSVPPTRRERGRVVGADMPDSAPITSPRHSAHRPMALSGVGRPHPHRRAS